MKNPTKLILFLSAFAVPGSLNAAAVFAPGNFVLGGRSDGSSFLGGTSGTDGGNNVYTDNVWPAGESPDHAIDGVGQKYLNFAELNTGIIVTPALGAGLGGTVVTSMQIWTANDADGRDPVSYSLYGTTNAIVGNTAAISDFDLISSGALNPPLTRNLGGANPLLVANSETVNFANTSAYTSYMIIFPTVRNEPGVNSMQIAEVQLFGDAVPEPGVLGLCGLSLVALGRRRRRA